MKTKSLLTISAFFVSTFVVSVSSVDAKNSSSTSLKTKKNGHKDSMLIGDFTFQSNQFADDIGEVTGNEYFGDFNIEYKSATDSNTKKNFELKSRMNNEEQLMYSIREANVEWNYSDSQIVLGRKNLNWSKADAAWGLGKVNNRVNFDFLEPGQEGLTGITYRKTVMKNFDVSVFGSFVYIPELNPGMKIDKDNGTIECQNPWCSAFDSSAPIEGKDIPIFYNVNYPKIEEIVNRQSFGINFDYKRNLDIEALSEKSGDILAKNNDIVARLNAFFMRKPENTLSVSAEIKYKVDEQLIYVDATPEVYYHDVSGGNISIDLAKYDLSLTGSYISISPNVYPDGGQKYIEYTGIKPNKKKEEYLSSGITFDNGTLKIVSGYIARVSEFDTENSLLVEYPRWNQAINLAASAKLTRKLQLEFDYKFDMLTEDRITMFNSSYMLGPNIIAGLGFNIIGTAKGKDSFWSNFENNDSLFSSLKFRF